MLIFPAQPVLQTAVFTALFLMALALSIRGRADGGGLRATTTDELKGFGFLTVLFAHVGFYLSRETSFLFPLSLLGGVGVNLFLLLSGYGLTRSAIERPTSHLTFYRKRFIKIFVPLWIVLIVLLGLDAIFLHVFFPLKTVVEAFIGFFPKADLYSSIDAPLWYLSLMLGEYVLFSFLFFRRLPFVSSLLVGWIGSWIVGRALPVDEGVLGLYRLHIFAFPLGMCLASLPTIGWMKLRITPWMRWARWPIMAMLAAIVAYTALHSGVGQGTMVEQKISLLTTLSVVAFFMIKPFELRLLRLFGRYSYEMYLLHWPFVYQFDPLFLWLPAWTALALSIPCVFGLARMVQKGNTLHLLLAKERG